MMARRPQRMSGLQLGTSSAVPAFDSQESTPQSADSAGSAGIGDVVDSAQEVEEFQHDADYFSKTFDFLPISRKSPSEQRAEIFSAVNDYYKYAASKVYDMRKSRRQSSNGALRQLDAGSSPDSMEIDEAEVAQSAVSDEELGYWEQEAQIWDLLRRLLPLRYSKRNTIKPNRREMSRFKSSSELWDDFLQNDSTAQERKAILECLQTTADESRIDIDDMVKESQQRAERGDIIAYGWLHTRSALKMQKSMNGWSGALDPTTSDAGQILDTTGSNPLVTQLDPDVATRQARKLQPQDEYFERAIWLGCYELLRRGRSIAEIRDWCVERTEVWRAVSMSAIPLSKDEGAEPFTPDPLSIILWRRTCFALARQGGIDDFERAVYGILSGDIQSVEKICENWDDLVYTHYNALLRSQFDSYLMKLLPPDSTATITQSFPAFNAVLFHGDSASAGERLFSSLESHPTISREAKSPLKSLQAAIMSNNLDQFLYEFGLFLGQKANEETQSALIHKYDDGGAKKDETRFFLASENRGMRALVHVYLIVSSLDDLQSSARADLSDRRRAQENIIATYVSTLRLRDMPYLMPLYCSRLQGDRALFTLSKNVSRITVENDRRQLLRIMEKLGMDIAKFVVFQPQSLFRQYPVTETRLPAFGRFTIFSNEPPSLKYGRLLKPEFFDDHAAQDPSAEDLISSLEWFLLVDDLWHETFQAGIAIYKRFLKEFNLTAARALSERVPCWAIFRQKAGLPLTEDLDASWFHEVRMGAEAGTLEENGIGVEEVAVARNFFEMESLVRTLDSMETLASYEDLSQDPTAELGREFWAPAGAEVKNVKSYMQFILHNWLMESVEDDEDFNFLREAYLPETILGYVSVLHFAGTTMSRDNLLECMELASIVAKKDADVASVLMKSGRMKELVEGFAMASKALAFTAEQKRGVGGSSKKMREMGWTRELWAVKP
ncbi:nuclear pore protein 84/107 [Xylariomycetidae sp. FL2044]|nr:nuclear pore protein 84/107 [Xylariomycetidae sp. FL2044]